MKILQIRYSPPTTFNVVQTDSLAASLKKKEEKKEGGKTDRQKERKEERKKENGIHHVTLKM